MMIRSIADDFGFDQDSIRAIETRFIFIYAMTLSLQ